MHKLYTYVFVDDGCVFIHANKTYLFPDLVWNGKGAKIVEYDSFAYVNIQVICLVIRILQSYDKMFPSK